MTVLGNKELIRSYCGTKIFRVYSRIFFSLLSVIKTSPSSSFRGLYDTVGLTQNVFFIRKDLSILFYCEVYLRGLVTVLVISHPGRKTPRHSLTRLISNLTIT